MSRVEAASGVNYTAKKEAPRRFEPIAPVGTAYKPVGKVDIAALRASAPPPAPAALTATPVVVVEEEEPESAPKLEPVEDLPPRPLA